MSVTEAQDYIEEQKYQIVFIDDNKSSLDILRPIVKEQIDRNQQNSGRSEAYHQLRCRVLEAFGSQCTDKCKQIEDKKTENGSKIFVGNPVVRRFDVCHNRRKYRK